MAIAVAAFASSRPHSRTLTYVLLLADALVLSAAASLFAHTTALSPAVIGICALGIIALLSISGTYRRSFGGSMRDEWYAVGAAISVVAIPLLTATFVLPSLWNSRSGAATFCVISFLGIALTRTIAHNRRVPRRLAIVGVPERIDFALVHLRPRHDDALLRLPLSNIEATLDEERFAPPWLQGAISWGATRVIVTEALPPERLGRIMAIAARHNVTIGIAPPRLRPQAYKMHIEREGGLSLLCPRPLPVCTQPAFIYKRLLDLSLTIPALVILAPLFAICALAIRLDSPGPIIYRQTRVGRHGKPFEMLKFRSMPTDSEAKTGPVWADPALPRATRVGKILRRLSIDEIPQLVNVLRGEMSLVGPRPERPYFVDRFRRTIPRYEERLLVLPGITGWSQISMKRILATDDVSVKLEGDLFYIEEWSPLFDAQIMVKTAIEFLFQRVA